MGLFDFTKSGPSSMGQLQFDQCVFQFYCERFKYDSFQNFWHANILEANGSSSRLVDRLYACETEFPNDDLLHAQLAQAGLEIEKYWFNTFGISPESLFIFSSIHSQAAQALEETLQLDPVENVELDPKLRVDRCVKSLKKYEQKPGSIRNTQI
jgi:hypothetical protein